MLTARPAASAKRTGGLSKQKPASKQLNELEFIQNRDYSGALALLEFKLKSGDGDPIQLLWWIGYAAFHNGNLERAVAAYKRLQTEFSVTDGQVDLCLACCLFRLQLDDEAEAHLAKAPASALKNRLLFHLAHRKNDEQKLMMYLQLLTEEKEDQLSLASMHYLRCHFQEAAEIYKKLLIAHRDELALNVCVAMCYYKLDYWDVAMEILSVYLQAFPTSAIAVNLKACCNFRLYNGKAAEHELRALSDQGVNVNSIDIIRHNRVVFSNGEQALSVLPSHVDVVPEARLNLVVYYLKHGAIEEAYELMRTVEVVTPAEYIIKAVVFASMGQRTDSLEQLRVAQQHFKVVGASPTECDTIPGRQCMASFLYLKRSFEEVNVYLNSIKVYMDNDDDFNWNYGISLASTGNFKAAEEALCSIQNERYKRDYDYLSWLARCYIMNKNPRSAWELYLKLDDSQDSFNLLLLVANDCYKMGLFVYAAKAFDVLERLDPDLEYADGKRGAFVGVFQQVVAGKASRDELQEVMQLFRTTSSPQVEYIMKIVKTWCSTHNIKI